MNRSRVYIKKTDQQSKTVFLPKVQIDEHNEFTSISFGTHSFSCTFSTHEEDHDYILISKDLWEELRLPYEGEIHIIPHDSTLHLGPLIGIFTAGFTDSPLRPVGERSLFFAKLLEVEQTVGAQSFIFGLHHLDWEKGTVKGFFYTEKGWTQLEVPFPNVVYDRLPNRKTENHSVLKKIKHRLKDEYLIPWFNPGFFSKWEIHQMFYKDPEIQGFLPETKLNPSVDDIDQFLKKYNNIYLKPANGSLGLGIYQIIYSRKDHHYYCRFRQDDENKLRKYTTLEKLVKNLFKNKSLETYIVQQGIPLLRINKKPIDFRIHTNKNNTGQWEMSAVAVKVAGTGSVTTHLRSGGEIKTIEEIFESITEKNLIIKRIQETTIRMSEILDSKIDGLIGEIGFDIGIDKHLNIWLFEANSKPGRSIFKHPKLKESDILSRKLPMSYAIYLTEQSIRQPEALYRK